MQNLVCELPRIRLPGTWVNRAYLSVMGPTTRLLTGLLSVALLVGALLALLPDCASACTCAAIGGSPQERAERALKESSAVFAGEVVDHKRGDTIWGGVPSTTVSFRV